MSSIKHSEHLIIKVIQMEFLGWMNFSPTAWMKHLTQTEVCCVWKPKRTSWNQFRFLFKWTDTKCSERPYLLTSLFKMLNHLLHDAQHRFLTVVSFLVHGDIGSICFLNAVSFDFWSLVAFIEPDWKQRPFLFWNPTPVLRCRTAPFQVCKSCKCCESENCYRSDASWLIMQRTTRDVGVSR